MLNREFMEKVKPKVLRIIRENRQMKIKMILSCEMVRDNEDLWLSLWPGSAGAGRGSADEQEPVIYRAKK